MSQPLLADDVPFALGMRIFKLLSDYELMALQTSPEAQEIDSFEVEGEPGRQYHCIMRKGGSGGCDLRGFASTPHGAVAMEVARLQGEINSRQKLIDYLLTAATGTM